MIRPTKYAPEKSEIAIVSTLKTKTVSGKSDLTYHLGKDDADTPYVRIFQNTGNGFFSNEWLPLASIIEILEKQGSDSFTSFVFDPLFSGKSVNTPAFLVAALLNEKVVAFAPNMRRKYVYLSSEKLLAKIDKGSPRKTTKRAVKKAATKKTARKQS